MESTETGEDESSNKKSKFIDQTNPSETVHNQRQADSGAQKRKDRVTDTEKTNVSEIISIGFHSYVALSHFKGEIEFK